MMRCMNPRLTLHFITLFCVCPCTQLSYTPHHRVDALIIFAFNLRTIVVARTLSVYRGEGQVMSGAGIL